MILYKLYENYNKSEYGVAKEPRLSFTIYAVVVCFLHITSFLSTVKNSPMKNGEMS